MTKNTFLLPSLPAVQLLQPLTPSQTTQELPRQFTSVASQPDLAGNPVKPALPALSVIVSCFNSGVWLERCLTSLRNQTLADEFEVIVADNASSDHSDVLAERLLNGWDQGRLLRHGANLGYAAGNNRAAHRAHGEYLFFLGPDSWLEPSCLEQLLIEARGTDACAAAPLVLDYESDQVQSAGAGGFNVFGFPCARASGPQRQEIFAGNGCGLLIRSDWFEWIGGFDPRFMMGAHEYDLCWRLWLGGGRVMLAPSARMHHRRPPAASAPHRCTSLMEERASDTNRFHTNRNNLLVVLKNSRNVLLSLVLLQIALLLAEAFWQLLWTGRWSHIRRVYLAAIWDCWRLRGHIGIERRRVRELRRHGDFWMLRFLRAQFNRWEKRRHCAQFVLPGVTSR
jgi:GT2 family glycosyltransferase